MISFHTDRLPVLLSILCCAMLMSCANKDKAEEKTLSNNESALEIVENSVARHGGWDLYDSLSSLSYTKRILLYDSLGELESDVTQSHTYNVRPDLSGAIEWVQANDTVKIIYKNDEAFKVLNGVKEENSSEKSLSTFMSGFYVTFQPLKIFDNPKQVVYAGTDTLRDNTSVFVIQPKDTTANADEWWYYFDQNDYTLIACMVKHGDSYSLIENLALDSTTGITFNAHRKSYFVDSNRTIKYLRAEYFYSDYKAEFRK